MKSFLRSSFAAPTSRVAISRKQQWGLRTLRSGVQQYRNICKASRLGQDCQNRCQPSKSLQRSLERRETKPAQRDLHTSTPVNARAAIPLDGKEVEISPILLRDLCQCPHCVHEFSRQRLYSTADIPKDIRVRSIDSGEHQNGGINVRWTNDLPGFDAGHVTSISAETLRQINSSGTIPSPFQGATPRHQLWSAASANVPDFTYETYMKDDATVYEVVKQLKSHGLVFITGCPGVEASVAEVGERIGPVRDTLYGRTWDVRTVPKAINAAYTSGDLGFHTDLLYFQDPPHLQLLHCIQSSSKGGASVFADGFRAALDLYDTDRDAFNVLLNTPVNYHYEHPGANLYMATKPVFQTRPLRIGTTTYETLTEFLEAWEARRQVVNKTHGTNVPALTVGDCLEKINWGPPFLAPCSLDPQSMEQTQHLDSSSCEEALNDKMDLWHSAAAKFNAFLNHPDGLHERLMKPGECVIFDNTRVLHSRRAFDSEDVGKARWLRGTYVDRDPYHSKMRVLRHKFGT
ncbi:Clavaminate synthase-like protein [Hortaea werneckii]|nr:Clavaminate synthase-like protein [Hortaea werneckii]